MISEAISYIKEKQKEYYEGTVTHNALRDLEISLPQIIERDFQSRESLLKEEVERLKKVLGLAEIGNSQKQHTIDVANGLVGSLNSKIQELEQKNKELREGLQNLIPFLYKPATNFSLVETEIEKLLKQ